MAGLFYQVNKTAVFPLVKYSLNKRFEVSLIGMFGDRLNHLTLLYEEETQIHTHDAE